MQIRELVLYSKGNKLRRIKFQLGTVNIITGESMSGKSAISDIIDYCLGGDSCNIAEGIIRKTVKWYGLLLQFENERVFVARKNPGIGKQTTNACYYEIGEYIEVPIKSNFKSNINVDGLEDILSKRLGIAENLNTPPSHQSRNPLSANIRHALYYCFQNQDEIAARSFIFHTQSEDFITQAIRDTLPYFLGIISEEALALENSRKVLNRKLRIEKRKIEENELFQGKGSSKSLSLISEAKNVGLIQNDFDFKSDKDIITLFKQILKWQPETASFPGVDRLSYLQTTLNKLNDQLAETNEKIMAANSFIGDTTNYSEEVEHQRLRLQSINLFEKLKFEERSCPFCYEKTSDKLPTNIKKIKKVITNLDESIKNVSREVPRLRSHLDVLESQKQNLLEEISNVKNDIDMFYKQNTQGKSIKDLNSRRAIIVGRISLWLESLEASTNQTREVNSIHDLERRLSIIDEELNTENIEERKQSVLSRLSSDMSNWAKELNLEHSDSPYRLDLKKVTVVIDTVDKPVTLRQIGSGSNWVGIHLITYFALHKYFIARSRPVPRFIFLDQPSQVYFPSQKEGEKDIDWKMVNKLYNFMFDRIKDEKGKLQLIIVDHAHLENDRFKEFVIENWWDDKKLIPIDWYDDNY